MQEFGNNRRNVVARWGSADRHILIGAHYDGQPGFPSASDNAAGVAVVIELARDLKAMNLPLSIVAVGFDDEEQGLNGSNFYVDHPIFPLEQLSAAFVFDTMGRHFLDLKKSTLFVLGAEYSKELAQVVDRRARADMLVAGADLIGPRSDFAGFARKKVPFLFFSHATHKDYHGEGDSPELLDYARMAEDVTVIEQMAVDLARSARNPVYLDTPVYGTREVDTLMQILTQVRQEKPDLPQAYRLVFADLEKRIQTDHSRATMNVASTALLALATPRLSSFLLEFIVAPAYQKDNKPEIARALLEEAARRER
jgi:Zn-dependent M28 family amino/carboxypeptidase